MPCDVTPRRGQTFVQRISEVELALRRLEQSLQTGIVRIVIAPNGAVALAGWRLEERADLSDVCAVRSLTVQNSWQLRQAIAKAEAMQGRKVDVRAVAAGTHSHDGGRTWDKGH